MAIVNELPANRDTFRLRAYSCRPTRKGIKLLRSTDVALLEGGGLRFPVAARHFCVPLNVARFFLFSLFAADKRC